MKFEVVISNKLYFCFLQLRVSVYDSEIPSVRNTETVTIGVNVNSNAPKFTLNPYVINISEDKQVGTLVTTVTAVDPDGVGGDTITYNFMMVLKTTINPVSFPHRQFNNDEI